MNTKLLSILFVLFLGIGFSSCSKDDGNKTDAGKTSGASFRSSVETAYASYQSGNTIQLATDALSLYSNYQAYKKNSSDSDWKKGFLEGAALNEAQGNQLDALLSKNFDATSILSILTDLNGVFNSGK